ncbi:MAG: SUMF1/EgtB/PvdO family nonheme iron enzyme [Pseudomonadota bacterium]|nr:SUMF1/EgtB/PvdO family nonheme iron enzyme [Pseudomonadota bacterium]
MSARNLENFSKDELMQLVRRLQDETAATVPEVVPGGHDPAAAQGVPIRFGIYQGSTPQSGGEALAIYRAVIACRLGVHQAVESHGRLLTLAQVYVEPDTTMTVSAEALQTALSGNAPPAALPATDAAGYGQPLPALAAAALHRRLLLLGKPGSGKTTFVNRLALALAGVDRPQPPQWPAWAGERLPIPVALRDFACWLRMQPLSPPPGAALLWAYIRHDLNRRNLDFAEALLHQALADGSAQVLLDGLDEVPPALGQWVEDTVTAFAAQHPRSWMLVTCRTAGHDRGRRRLVQGQFTVGRLAEFDAAKIHCFITMWHHAVAARQGQAWSNAGAWAARFMVALERPELARLAANPLLLTTLALVYTRDRVLPEHRAAVYGRAVDILLGSGQGHRLEDGDEPNLWRRLREAECGIMDLLVALRWLAYEAQERSAAGGDPERPADIDEAVLWKVLARLHPRQNLDWARALMADLVQQTGLLVEQEPEVFAFPHRTFQEYLAGVQLAAGRHFVRAASHLAEAGGHWREVILLSVGYQVHSKGELDAPLALINALCPSGEPGGDSDWHKVCLAGEALLEIGVQRVERQGPRGKGLLERARRQLAALLERGLLRCGERARAGDVLGRLGDPRFDPQFFHLPRRHLGEVDRVRGFVLIPRGPFDRIDAAPAAGDQPHLDHATLLIPYDCWMSRYPVTVAQFAAFVTDGGYADEGWWRDEAALDWLRRERAVAPGHWRRQRDCASRPVVFVSAFEAAAYCAWLDERLRRLHRNPLPAGCTVRLPSEAEWEKAAGGRYPWIGGRWDQQLGNLGGTFDRCTPVGMYPAGATPAGIYDLAGNVWEWTLSDTGDGRRVCRGGSFREPPEAGCAARTGRDATARIDDTGFRVAVAVAEGII